MAMICCSVTAKSKGTGQWALDNGHWTMGTGQWALVEEGHWWHNGTGTRKVPCTNFCTPL